MTTATRVGRLENKVALITGATGDVGKIISQRFLAEGATIAITGRDRDELQACRQHLVEAENVPEDRVLTVRMDGSDMADVRAGVAEIVARCGRIDVLVNNSGSIGPRRTLAEIPLTAAELEAPDTESLLDALGNVLGATWNLTRAVAPHMRAGGSIINVSTIFSRTDYYGRISYVVPKAALNALSDGLANELGARGIRVNTIYPGPIEGERIRGVFKAMDTLKGQPEGTTATQFLDVMRLNRPDEAGSPAKRFPTADDVANTAAFLASDESAAFAGHNFEVTHGMAIPAESFTTFSSRPGLRAVDASGTVILISAGNQVEDALDLSDMLRACRATVVIGFRDPDALDRAEALLREARRPISADMYGHPTSAPPPLLLRLDPLDPAAAAEALTQARDVVGIPKHALILPAAGLDGSSGAAALVEADDKVVEQLLRDELGGAVAIGRLLARFWSDGGSEHRVLFVTNPNDGRGNRFANVLRAGVEQLCRVWRHESALGAAAIWSNQLVRYSNVEGVATDFAAGWAARLLGSAKRVDEINLYLPKRLAGSIGVHTREFGFAESLFGMHMGKVALITGGSAGIGGQLGRLLAISGAYIVLAARRAEELERVQAKIVREVRDAGYMDAANRVHILPNCDVGEEESWQRMVDDTLAIHGRVDYLINNAGVAGAEEMVIDMPHDAWRRTIKANLLSNYAAIRMLAPAMKERGGYIINVSSYFGGEKYVAIPYPNRSDYAVSKAGQRALVEALAHFMGPQVQINALAPGPVEGERLKGAGSRPGLFARRARLILENKRLNELHAALFAAQRESGGAVSDLLPFLAANQVQALADSNAPAALRRLATQILKTTEADACARTCLMNETIARKLVRRLVVGGEMHGVSEANSQVSLAGVTEPFFAQAQIDREAAKVRDGVIGMLDLGRMPTEFEVALATVFYLADRNVTGETFHPSGGLNFERTVTEGELFGRASQQRLDKLAGATVFLVGEYMRKHLIALAQSFLDEHHAARVVFITETEKAASALTSALPAHEAAGRVVALAAGADMEGAIERARSQFGRPGPVVSTPFRPLPQRRLAASRSDWDDVLTTEEFIDLVEQHITHHFRVAQKASLMEGANLTLVTAPTSAHSTAEEFALAHFIKTTMHAFTATLGAESERTAHHVPVNEIDLTRRARNEEPQTPAEEEEELARFVTAVLLTSAPLPTPQESRYRSRIYRGKAITV